MGDFLSVDERWRTRAQPYGGARQRLTGEDEVKGCAAWGRRVMQRVVGVVAAKIEMRRIQYFTKNSRILVTRGIDEITLVPC